MSYLNYNKYFFEGTKLKNIYDEYNSFNTHRLGESQLIDLLFSIGYQG